jgi:hypothetical protein
VVDAFVTAAHVRPESAARSLAARPPLVALRSSWGETALEAASHLGNKSLAWRCIEAGASADLFAACAVGDLRLAMLRFDSGSRDARGVHGLPLLHFAIVGGNQDLLESLLAGGAEVNPLGSAVTPLHSAVAAGCAEAIKRLLGAGADVDVVDSFGATPMDWAIDLDGREGVAARLIARFTASGG